MNNYEVLEIKDITDHRGSLFVVENLLPFDIKRFFYITNPVGTRGGHRHKKTWQAMICLNGSSDIYMNNGDKEEVITLNTPNKCLIIKPEDWHHMTNFSDNCVLLILASEEFDKNDYIMENYENNTL